MQILGRPQAALGSTFLLVAVAIATLSVPPARAASGDLDSGFGSAGVVTLSPGTSSLANAVAVQGDGQIVVAGYAITSAPGNMTVARLDSSGTPDPAFGSGGVVTVLSGVQTIGYALAIQPGGEILVAGGILAPSIENDYLIARLLPSDGQLDSSFGSGGVVVTDALSSDGRGALALQADGKIVLGGSIKRRPSGPILSNRDFLVARYLSDGTPDPSFGDAGQATVSMGGRSDAISGLLIQPDGHIVASGYAVSKGRSRVAVTRLDSSGGLDPAVAQRGRYRHRLVSRQDFATGLAGLPDGSLVLGGVSVVEAYPQHIIITLAQLTPGGSLDPSFGTEGVATFDPDPSTSHVVNALVRQPDGKIVLAGSVNGPTGEPTGGILVLRTLADGSLDTSFGTGGIVNTPLGDQATALAVALQADGKIVTAGYTVMGGTAHFVIARYLP